jgi:hypothetical protein
MKMYKVPAVSIAVIDNFKIDWATVLGMPACNFRRRTLLGGTTKQ